MERNYRQRHNILYNSTYPQLIFSTASPQISTSAAQWTHHNRHPPLPQRRLIHVRLYLPPSRQNSASCVATVDTLFPAPTTSLPFSTLAARPVSSPLTAAPQHLPFLLSHPTCPVLSITIAPSPSSTNCPTRTLTP